MYIFLHVGFHNVELRLHFMLKKGCPSCVPKNPMCCPNTPHIGVTVVTCTLNGPDWGVRAPKRSIQFSSNKLEFVHLGRPLVLMYKYA